MAWEPADFILENLPAVPRKAAENLSRLFEAECTVPFVARYRQEQAGGLDVSVIRKVHQLWEDSKKLSKKIAGVCDQLASQNKLTKELERSVKSCLTKEELDTVSSAFLKPSAKGTLSERAKALGLEDHALNIWRGQETVKLKALINPSIEGLKDESQVKRGLQHILADWMFHVPEIRSFLNKMLTDERIILKSTSTAKVGDKASTENASKFEEYFQFNRRICELRSYQTLAINRGESLKVLGVKLVFPSDFVEKFGACVASEIGRRIRQEWQSLLKSTVSDCWTRLVQPFMNRHVRSHLTKVAEDDSLEVFATNLKQLLLTKPVKHCNVLGVDPGFSHGCKCAAISSSGQVLGTGVFYIHKKDGGIKLLNDLINEHRCSKIAIGNGVGCRKAEELVSEMMQKSSLWSSSVQFCIVNESGASVYSASELAKLELPDMDIKFRGAVSIARRLQDPLAEYVKIEPQHLGVGMYQHSVNSKKLKITLESVVQECVSFAGVDINTSSVHLLERVAGLNKARALKVVQFRDVNKFVNRQQLLEVSGIGPKVYQQCSGFLRIYSDIKKEKPLNDGMKFPELDEATCSGSRKRKCNGGEVPQKKKVKKGTPMSSKNYEYNIMDATSIHPEWYSTVEKLLKDVLKMTAFDIGKSSMSSAISKISHDLNNVASLLGVGELTLRSILDCLQQPIDYDIRDRFETPLFRQSVQCLDSIRAGERLTGCVRNVTRFGAFVDIGCGVDGLIHISEPGCRNLQINDNVTVLVNTVDKNRKRIGLKLH